MLKGLADPTRLRILGLLQGGETCVCHIFEALDIPQPKASRHLAYLRRAGLVESEKRGLWVYYRLAARRAKTVDAAVAAIVDCLECLPSVKRDAARLSATVPACAPGSAACGPKPPPGRRPTRRGKRASAGR